MNSRTTFALFGLVGLFVLPWPTGAQEPLAVSLTGPVAGAPLFGPVEVTVAVTGTEAVRHVELYVDDRKPVLLGRAPFVTTVDVGEDNRAHRFRAVAHGVNGTVAETVVETTAIKINAAVTFELRQLYVTVLDGKERVKQLPRGDFRVFDDGALQELVTFEQGNAALTAVLLVDSSESMAGSRLEAALAGAHTFAKGMLELDEAAVLLFSDRLLKATPFTNSADELERSLAGAEAGGGTALTDHLYSALKLLDARQGRRVVVVLSDGKDVHSALSMQDVLWKARRSQAMIYWIQLAEEKVSEAVSFSSAWRNADANRAELAAFTEAVEQSGGRVLTIERVEEASAAFRAVIEELRDQYVLGYYPSKIRADGSWHTVKVDLRRGGYAVRTREGYVDY